MKDDPRKRVDRTGRSQFVRKTTQPERDRRDGWIMRLWRQGHNVQEIAEALDVSIGLVAETVRNMLPDRPRRYVGRGPVTKHCPWRDEDVPQWDLDIPTPEQQQSRWRQSRIVGMAQMLNDEYRETNFSNILANQVTDAEEAGDQDWMLQALATFTSAIEKLERARRVLSDDSYRVRCRDTLEGVEQMRHKNPPLRAVT